MEIITAKRFLVRSLFDGERTCQLMLVDLTGPTLRVTPFDVETPATIFLDRRVVLFASPLTEIPNLESRLLSFSLGNFSEAALSPFLALLDITASDDVVAVAY